MSKGKNIGNFIADFPLNGLDAATLFKDKLYFGLEGILDINSKNNAAIPTRRALINVYACQLFGLNSFSNDVLQTGLEIRIFLSFIQQTRYVFATRLGVGHNFGKYDFQQAQYLSGKVNVRGFRRERFSGRTMLLITPKSGTR